MKGKLKRLIICVFSIMLLCIIEEMDIFAEELVSIQNQNTDFITMFYSGEYHIAATNFEGEDITSLFLGQTQSLYEENKIDDIKDTIAQEGIVLHIISYSEDNVLRAYDKYKTVRSDMIYFELEDQNRATRICVTAELSGAIWYNENTSQVTKVSNTTYSILGIDTNTGLSVTTNDFSTGSSVQNGKGYFWGKCGFVSQGQIVQNGIPYTTYLEYGPKMVSFYAVP
ncbi:MAG: hypothetical protein J6D08_14185 [Lachnospiraceae bacterium]|nr:hypothetical protein [Lachnospiraceae bacterium]